MRGVITHSIFPFERVELASDHIDLSECYTIFEGLSISAVFDACAKVEPMFVEGESRSRYALSVGE